MATKKLRRDKLKARKRVPNKDVCAHNNFAQILSSSVQKCIKSLHNSNSSLDKKNVLSPATGHMSRLQMPSEEAALSSAKSSSNYEASSIQSQCLSCSEC
jgi:hypothetical protein